MHFPAGNAIIIRHDRYGRLVKRSRRRPLTAETGVRFPYRRSCPEKEQDFHGTYVYDTGSFCFEPCGVPPACAGPRREREVSRFPVSSRKAGSPLFPCDLAKAGRFLFWQKHFLCRPFFCPYGHTLTFSIEYQRNRRRCADRKGPDIPVRPFNVHEAISIKKQPARMAGCQKT